METETHITYKEGDLVRINPTPPSGRFGSTARRLQDKSLRVDYYERGTYRGGIVSVAPITGGRSFRIYADTVVPL